MSRKNEELKERGHELDNLKHHYEISVDRVEADLMQKLQQEEKQI